MKSDLEVKKDVEQEFEWDPAVDAADIGVEVHGGIVTLAGHLRNYVEKLAARKAAQRVEGVKGVVVNLAVRLADDSQPSDEDIAAAARAVLHWNTGVAEKSVQVTVEKGCLTLSGEVDWGYQLRAAEKAVAPLRGVKVIVNQIQLRHRPTPLDVASKIEAALKRHAELEARQITVQVADGTVTVRGKASSFVEKASICNAAWSAPGVRKVIDEVTVVRV